MNLILWIIGYMRNAPYFKSTEGMSKQASSLKILFEKLGRNGLNDEGIFLVEVHLFEALLIVDDYDIKEQFVGILVVPFSEERSKAVHDLTALAVVTQHDDLLFLEPEILVEPYRDSGDLVASVLICILLVQSHEIAVVLIVLGLDCERDDAVVAGKSALDIGHLIIFFAGSCVECRALVGEELVVDGIELRHQ